MGNKGCTYSESSCSEYDWWSCGSFELLITCRLLMLFRCACRILRGRNCFRLSCYSYKGIVLAFVGDWGLFSSKFGSVLVVSSRWDEQLYWLSKSMIVLYVGCLFFFLVLCKTKKIPEYITKYRQVMIFVGNRNSRWWMASYWTGSVDEHFVGFASPSSRFWLLYRESCDFGGTAVSVYVYSIMTPAWFIQSMLVNCVLLERSWLPLVCVNNLSVNILEYTRLYRTFGRKILDNNSWFAFRSFYFLVLDTCICAMNYCQADNVWLATIYVWLVGRLNAHTQTHTWKRRGMDWRTNLTSHDWRQ